MDSIGLDHNRMHVTLSLRKVRFREKSAVFAKLLLFVDGSETAKISKQVPTGLGAVRPTPAQGNSTDRQTEKSKFLRNFDFPSSIGKESETVSQFSGEHAKKRNAHLEKNKRKFSCSHSFCLKVSVDLFVSVEKLLQRDFPPSYRTSSLFSYKSFGCD